MVLLTMHAVLPALQNQRTNLFLFILVTTKFSTMSSTFFTLEGDVWSRKNSSTFRYSTEVMLAVNKILVQTSAGRKLDAEFTKEKGTWNIGYRENYSSQISEGMWMKEDMEIFGTANCCFYVFSYTTVCSIHITVL